MVTDETVTHAVEALFAEKLDPTVERVRAKLGGGSYTTINRVLAAVLQNRQSQATQISDVPPTLSRSANVPSAPSTLPCNGRRLARSS
jgi:hypothetical protein